MYSTQDKRQHINFPLLVEFTKQFDEAGELGQRKEFHHLPSYATDIEKVVKDLLEKNVLQ